MKESVKKQVNSFENIIDEKQMRLEGIEAQIRAAEEQLRELESIKDERSVATGQMFFTRTTGYCNSGLKSDYQNIRENFSLNSSEIVKGLVEENDGRTGDYFRYKAIRETYDMLKGDLCYKLILFDEAEQKSILESCLEPAQRRLYSEFCENEGAVTADRFLYWLDTRISAEDPAILVRTSNHRDDYSAFSRNVVTEYDENLCEGIQVIAGRRLFDYSISHSELL